MGKYQKAKGRSEDKFVKLTHGMAKSPAWRSLSPIARCVWLELMMRFNSFNNGQVYLSCREAADACHVSKNTASKAFKELQEKGFILPAMVSSFTCKYKKATRWIMTHQPYEGKAPTAQFRNWRPSENPDSLN